MSLQSSSELWDAATFWLAVVGTVLLFVSVLTGIVARRYARRLSEETAAQSERERTAHNDAIAKLGLQVAEANARAKEAEARAAEANLELERLRTPRMIAPEQRDRILEEIKAFPDTAIELYSYPGNNEARRLRDQIREVLTTAKWNPFTSLGPNISPESMVPADGILVEVANHATRADRDAAEVLMAALRREGFQVKGPEWMMNVSGRIRLTVGNKA